LSGRRLTLRAWSPATRTSSTKSSSTPWNGGFNASWQGWHLDKDRLVLWHDTLAASRGYEINLLTCTTRAVLLGWIMEITADAGMVVIGLVRAFDGTLHPRINLCLDRETRSRRLSQRAIRKLVADAQEPGPDGSR
jgi:hypothetical protein